MFFVVISLLYYAYFFIGIKKKYNWDEKLNYKFNGKKIKGGPDGNGRYYVHDYDENGIEDGDEDYDTGYIENEKDEIQESCKQRTFIPVKFKVYCEIINNRTTI